MAYSQQLFRAKNESMRPVEFCEAFLAGTRLTLFSDDKPERLFTVIKFWVDEGLSIPLKLSSGVSCYPIEDEEGRIHLPIQLPIEEEGETADASAVPIRQDLIPGPVFNGALLEE